MLRIFVTFFTLYLIQFLFIKAMKIKDCMIILFITIYVCSIKSLFPLLMHDIDKLI